jgi:hypothetical protein
MKTLLELCESHFCKEIGRKISAQCRLRKKEHVFFGDEKKLSG